MADQQDTPIPKCAACGFLTMRNRFTGQLDEMDSDFRRTGNPPQRLIMDADADSRPIGNPTTTPYRHVPICFARSLNLAAEWPGGAELQDRYPDWPASLVLETITKERPECEGKFTTWQQGFTPKEHREMLDREQVLERDDRLRKDAQDREDKRDTDQREWQKTMTEASWKRDDRRHTREMWIIGGVVTLIVVLSTIAGAMIEAGWIAKPW